MPRAAVRALATLLFVSAAATVVVAGAAGLEAGSVPDYLLSGRNGLLQLARAAVAVVGGVALLAPGPPRLAAAVAAVTGLAGIVLLVAAGHASALATPVPTIGQVVHVAGAAVWIGGIVCLLALATRPALLVDGPVPAMRSLVPRFSALALAAIGLVALTGVYQSYAQTGVLLDTGTEYGRTLLLKTGTALAAFALGGLNYLDGGRLMGWLGGFRNRITVEVLLATGVLVLTAALAITPPVDQPTGVGIQPIPDAFGDVAPGMSMEVIPGRPGLNRIVVTTTDALATSSTLELGLDDLDSGIDHAGAARAGVDAGDEPRRARGWSTRPRTGRSIGRPMRSCCRPAANGTRASGSWRPPAARRSRANDSRSRCRTMGSTRDVSTSLVNPATAVASLLILGGALGLGLGIGGASLPRCEAAASRLALLAGGGIAVVLGAAIGASQLVG